MGVPFLRLVILIAILILQLSTHIKSISSTFSYPPSNTDSEYIKTSCNVTLYPKLCYRTLSYYARKIKTDPKLLANTALNVSLISTKSTARLARKMSRLGLGPREAAALEDCVEVVGDSMYELQRSMEEMNELKGYDFEQLLSDIQTWVSAALTDDETCMDGVNEQVGNGYVKTIVRKHILRIAHLTSNALAIINSFASSVDANFH